MNQAFREYFAFMDRLGKALEELTELAKQKTIAVRRDDILAVNECMKREQALSLSLRSMDKKREQMLTAMGIKDSTLSGLVKACPEELRGEAAAAAERLRDRYTIYNSAADVARTTLECTLHQIDKMVEERTETPMNGSHVTDFRA